MLDIVKNRIRRVLQRNEATMLVRPDVFHVGVLLVLQCRFARLSGVSKVTEAKLEKLEHFSH